MTMEGVLFAERVEWEDVVPVEQYEGVRPLAPIFYTSEYKDATGYFRAIVKRGETSERVLDLTENIIRQNPAHYSAWQYRYRTLVALDAPLEGELELMDELAVQFLKTYQVWHHRRLLVRLGVERAADTEAVGAVVGRELAFTARCLRCADGKNYHTWSYRQWLLAHLCVGVGAGAGAGVWAEERAFVDGMLRADVRNNSAWHHRFVVVFQTGVRAGEEADRAAVVRGELAYVQAKISLAPNNASAWNYLRGVLDHAHAPYADVRSFVAPYCAASAREAEAEGEDGGEDGVVDVDALGPAGGAQLPCVAALEFMADIHEQAKSLAAAVELWSALANTHDRIRHKYWESRIREARARSIGL